MCALPACATARPVAVLADETLAPGVALASFDSVWTIVHNTYVDTAFVSTTWVAVRDSLRPRAVGVTKRRDLDRLLAETLERISDSHFYIIPARVASRDSVTRTDGRGTVGISVRAIGQEAVVWRVDPGSPGARAGISPGQVVKRAGTRVPAVSLGKIRKMPEEARPRALSEFLQSINAALSPTVGDTVRVEISEAGRVRTHTLRAIPAQGRVSRYGNLPPIAGLVRGYRVPAAGGKCVGVVAFNIWLPALVGDLERAVDSVRTCSGVVIDLRGNPGGLGAMVMGFGGYFVDSVQSLGTMRMRQLSLNFVINPRNSRDDGTSVSPIRGPVAILVDPMSASTSEIFAAGMQRIGRARVFGERSAGAALPALMNELPSGDVFVHAIADFTDPAGRRIEGTGAVPDEMVPLSIKDLSEGKDAPLDAAMRWIAASTNAR